MPGKAPANAPAATCWPTLDDVCRVRIPLQRDDGIALNRRIGKRPDARRLHVDADRERAPAAEFLPVRADELDRDRRRQQHGEGDASRRPRRDRIRQEQRQDARDVGEVARPKARAAPPAREEAVLQQQDARPRPTTRRAAAACGVRARSACHNPISEKTAIGREDEQVLFPD